MNKKLMFHVEHQFNLLKVQLINKYKFKNQITMLIILYYLKITLMKKYKSYNKCFNHKNCGYLCFT